MSAFYNEHDAYAAAWLRNLIDAGHIAPGVVDERDIRDIEPDELRGFTQCHFFAGIGIWSHALRRAGWADDRPVWTGSCPCQPFSAAGRGDGFADERHLWPHWHHLIRECRPAIVLGEQVASNDGLAWLDLVQTDMEATAYAFAPVDLCAAGFSGAHIRQRLYFGGVGDGGGAGLERHAGHDGPARWEGPHGPIAAPSLFGGVADAADVGLHGRAGYDAEGTGSRRHGYGERCEAGGAGAPLCGRHAVDWLFCRDGNWRPVEPGTFPLADAAPARVGRLRAYGNGLDAETATEFITGLMDALAIDWRAVVPAGPAQGRFVV